MKIVVTQNLGTHIHHFMENVQYWSFPVGYDDFYIHFHVITSWFQFLLRLKECHVIDYFTLLFPRKPKLEALISTESNSFPLIRHQLKFLSYTERLLWITDQDRSQFWLVTMIKSNKEAAVALSSCSIFPRVLRASLQGTQ